MERQASAKSVIKSAGGVNLNHNNETVWNLFTLENASNVVFSAPLCFNWATDAVECKNNT